MEASGETLRIVFTALVTAVSVGVFCIWKFVFGTPDLHNVEDSDLKPQIKDYKKDKIYVFKLPNISPFNLKLESFLKYSKLDYEEVAGFHIGKSPRQKLPAIELNGKVYTDSAVIIEHLCNHFNVQIDDNLSEEQKAISNAFVRLLENHFVFAAVYDRWHYEPGWKQFSAEILPNAIIRNIIGPFIRARVKRDLWGHGVSRHCIQNIRKFADDDLQSVSTMLGNKKYFFGNDIHLIDIVLYGVIGAFFYESKTIVPLFEIVKRYPNIVSHYERMKQVIATRQYS
eukprot:TRINITY_DN2767_c0_g1_i2.p1 TRINITY_DN2767_c0_g1~~TRINITY_DN2767_c0_g1_i2.p1  ORF type:complete len:284 (+),score=56.54 TRINITY_DN2767_c0_g1_i2:108-959(+)